MPSVRLLYCCSLVSFYYLMAQRIKTPSLVVENQYKNIVVISDLLAPDKKAGTSL